MEIRLSPEEIETITQKIRVFCDSTQTNMMQLDHLINQVLGNTRNARLLQAFEEYEVLQKQMGSYLMNLETIRQELVAISEGYRAVNK